jgi:hypothetical protein
LAKQEVISSEQLQVNPWIINLEHLIVMPIVSLWCRRQEHSDAMIANFFITLAQIALTFAVVLLWFFG